VRGAAELALRTLRAAGDTGVTTAELAQAGVANHHSALRTLRGGGHVIESSRETLGPPFHVAITRYRLVVDRTPALFGDDS
jgi:hypothetical protein